MVKGLEIFCDHFSEFTDRYIMIGGTACDLAMTEAGIEFRATRDLDIVLCLHKVDNDFVKMFWKFITNGNYQQREKSNKRREFYRFQQPSNPNFPTMLELFSNRPDALDCEQHRTITPIHIDDEISSLSAIILDDDYYKWIQDGKQITKGISTLRPEHLIPLKVRAWLDLRDRTKEGENIDSKNIKKHKNDVFRLYNIIDPGFRAPLARKISMDMKRFFSEITNEQINLQQLGLGSTTIPSVLDTLRRMYQLNKDKRTP